MGKPEPVAYSDYAPESSSTYTQPGTSYRSAPDLALPPHQNDDLPPTYDDSADALGSTSLSAPLLANYPASDFPSDAAAPPPPFPSDQNPDALQPFTREESLARYLDRRLDNDPALLESRVRHWASVPPRPFVRVHGTHRQRHRNAHGKEEDRHVTDFDVRVELTPHPWVDAAARRAWNELRTVGDADEARRGTVFRHRGAGGSGGGGGVLATEEKPSLTQWCHRYCASHSGLKTFALKRRVLGLDEARVREQVEAMARRTNYRGRLSVTFPVRDEAVEVWNECTANRWRLTRWIYLLFCVSMLWLLTWPVLFFLTRKFETVSSDWYFSRIGGGGRKVYVSLSEDQWYNMWGRALARAVLSKRQGTLDQTDLLAADAPEPLINTGSASVDGALGFLRAGASAVTEVNRHLGWGEDDF